jgi:hypothetical protein
MTSVWSADARKTCDILLAYTSLSYGGYTCTNCNRGEYVLHTLPDLWQPLVLGIVAIAGLTLNVSSILIIVSRVFRSSRRDAATRVSCKLRGVTGLGEKR